MIYFSLNNRSLIADFRQATIEGQAPDKGLYFPAEIPVWKERFKQDLKNLSNQEIAFEIMQP